MLLKMRYIFVDPVPAKRLINVSAKCSVQKQNRCLKFAGNTLISIITSNSRGAGATG